MASLDPGDKIESRIREHQSTARGFRARKRHWCDERWAHDRQIQPGELYVRLVAFPGHDANTSDRPSVMKLCAPCARSYPLSAQALQLRKLRDHVAARDIDGLVKCLADGMAWPKVTRS